MDCHEFLVEESMLEKYVTVSCLSRAPSCDGNVPDFVLSIVEEALKIVEKKVRENFADNFDAILHADFGTNVFFHYVKRCSNCERLLNERYSSIVRKEGFKEHTCDTI